MCVLFVGTKGTILEYDCRINRSIYTCTCILEHTGTGERWLFYKFAFRFYFVIQEKDYF